MATNPQGNTPALRPQSNQLIRADGTESAIKWIREATAIKRIRRTLARRSHSFQIQSEGTKARDEIGQYAVLDERKEILSANCKLPELARFLGVLADDELIEPPAERGWVFHVARERVEVIGGKRVRLRDRLTKDFKTEKAARKAVAKIEDRTGMVIVGMDANDALAVRFEEEQQARQAEALAEIESAIEGNPTLRYLRSEAGSQADWNRAVAIDLELQSDPARAGKPVAERFAEVASRLSAESEASAHG